MPIDIKEFERGPERDLRAEGRTNAEQILAFLTAHADKAYTPKEIHDATEVTRGSVGAVLSRLEDRGVVRHRGEYWAIAPEAEADETLTAMAAARGATERFGPEDPEEWGPGVDAESGERAEEEK